MIIWTPMKYSRTNVCYYHGNGRKGVYYMDEYDNGKWEVNWESDNKDEKALITICDGVSLSQGLELAEQYDAH